ncbi:cytochrome c oxidase assembly factor Coa1 family protein [Fulvivirga lutimaris]|uniref:cytochrome c oxidase assembly factor Coa1 family protein n=1 Tax=Fulvivirga lutimaris TaxID=1819566 RepID=UPI0012BCC31C|nr:cytochrome c oxidase assembly factor Coa1 family protein [Fulvivirga lutimaris]MTI39291.1 hypothetical protein [Fulvivirga lutimaris]
MSSNKLIRRIIVGILLTVIAVFSIMWLQTSRAFNEQFSNSDAFKTSLNYIKTDSLISSEIGDIIEIDNSISGYLTPNKSARLVFDVKGSQLEVTFKVKLNFIDDKWEIESIEYSK